MKKVQWCIAVRRTGPLNTNLTCTATLAAVILKLLKILLGRPERSSGRPHVLPVMFFFYSPGYLRAPSADRLETLPHDRNMGVRYNISPKIRRAHPKEIGGQKHAKFGAISDNFRLRSRISPERVKISKIGKTLDHQRFLPRWKKSDELWSTNYRELYVSMNPPKLHFSGDYISALRGCWPLKF